MSKDSLATLRKTLLGLGLLGSLPAVSFGAGFSEDFNNGAASLANWTAYSPLTAFGAPAASSVVSGALKIEASGSPAPALIGPGRGGSFRLDETFGDFSISYDIVSWSTAPFFAGAFVRASDLGLGTTDAYAAGFDFSGNRLFISRIENENVAQVVAVSEAVTLDPAKTYRLSFTGIGSEFTGYITENGSGNVLAAIAGVDGAYASGVVGLGLAVQSFDPGIGATVTFDNVVATVPEPSITALVGLGALSLGMLRRARKN